MVIWEQIGVDWAPAVTISLLSFQWLNNSPMKSAEKEVGPFRKDPVVWGTFEF